MRSTKFYQRLLAFVLSFAMLLPMAPVSARAESATAAANIVMSETISVPGYPGGTDTKISNVMAYDCGNGVSGKGEKSYLTVVTNTTSAQFLAYRDVLKQANYTLVMENEVASDDANDPNRFASYLAPDGSYKLYVYHFPFYQETRIIVDTQEDTVAGFSYTPGTETVQPMMVLYGLSMSENGYDNTTTTAYSTDKRNCGALIVIRMPDNSLFIHDGGDLEQWSDEACDRFMEFCRELTGKKEGEKITINTWFLSHAHTDHYLGLPRFFSRHHDQFDLKNIMYNIDIERTNTTRDIHGIMSMVSSYYPDVKYYKPHTGETFNIAGIGFDVIYAPEDRYLPNENGELITDYPYDVGGTYRDFCYDTNGDPTTESDFNDTSVVLRVHMDENTDALLYADMNRVEQVLFDIYPDSALETDIMMIPHHGFDSHPKLCELSKAKVFLFTQHRGAIYGADGDLSTKDPDGQYRPKLYNNYIKMQPYIETEGSQTYWAGNETVCLTVGSSASVVPDGMTAAAAPTGFTAYTAPAYSFVYEGWTVDGSDDTTISGDWQGAFPEVQTNSRTLRFEPVTSALDASKSYVIVHDASDKILLHDAVAQKTTSQPVGSAEDAADGKVSFYYATSNGVENLYFPHYYRDQAMWKMLNLYTPDPNNTKDANHPLTGGQTAKFGGVATYRYSNYTKGLNTDDSFWYTTAADTEATRALQPNKETLALADPTSQNIYTEFFSDGTCVIFYYKSDGTSIAFLTVDSNGNWVRKLYKDTDKTANANAVKADLSQLKLRLYSYYEAKADTQTVAYEGTQDYMVLTTVSQAETVSLISSGIRVMDTSRRNLLIPCSGTTPKTGYYYLDFADNYSAVTLGDYLVEILYRNDDGTDTLVGTVAVHVIEKIAISGARLDIAGTVSQNAGVGAIPQVINSKTGETTDCLISVTYNTAEGHVTQQIPLSVGMLTDSEGKPVDTSKEGTYSGLTVTYQGVELTGEFTLTVSAHNDILNYPKYPEEGSVRVTKQGITNLGEFTSTGVANIQLSATGMPTSNGVDLIIVMDLSGSMRYGLDNTTRVDQQNFEATRLYAMEQSLTQMVTMLRDSGADVRIAMSDFGDLDSHEFEGAIVDYSIRNKPFFDVDFNNAYKRSDDYTTDFYEFSNYLNFPMKSGDMDAVAYPVANSKFNISNPSYTGKVVPTIYTGSHEANAAAFVNVQDLDDAAMGEIIAALNVDITKSNGTNYDVGLEYAYHMGYAIQQQNIAEGQDRDLVIIFMSDGAPMQFNYFSGRPHMSGWSDWITGNADGIYSLGYSETNKPAGMAELESALLELLKKGELRNPDWRRDDSTVTNKVGYFAYDATKVAEYEYFYTYMDVQGYDLDWEYLVDIAKANGHPNFDYAYYQQNFQMTDLIDKLKNGTLVNPRYNNADYPHYYPQYTGTSTDFFAAMKDLGYDISWDQFAKIAYKNRKVIDPNTIDPEDPENATNDPTKNITVHTRLMTMLNGIRNVPEGQYATLSPYAYFYNENGLNWWAEAIKGKTTELYPVINKYAFSNSTERPYGYYGDVRNQFSGETTKNLPLDGQDYIGGFRGLDADIYSVSFSIANERELSAEDAEIVMRRIATGPSYFFAANTQDGLTKALKAIASTVTRGASNAWYTDTMGPEFDLSTSRTVQTEDGEVTVNATPTIRVLEYELNLDGLREDEEPKAVREVVSFGTAPKEGEAVLNAWSDQVYTTSVDDSGQIHQTHTELLGADGVIRAKYFYYNTNKYVDETNTGTVSIDTNGDGVLDRELPAETFLWGIGAIGKTEMVLEYQVYLTGSMEGTREAGLYDTNTHAELTYDNYLGNDCAQEVPTPKYPWDQGSVGYAFYLVDRDGNPIVNQETGATGSFELSVELTDIFHQQFDLGGQPHTVTAKDVMEQLIQSGEMPEGYTLYDPTASYTVTVNSNVDSGTNGTYKVEGGVTRPTTWISGLQYDDVLPEPGTTYEVTDASTANTTVWFAVYIDVQTYPDAVVIDYGIPVDIHVMANDSQMPAKYAELAAIGAYRDAGYTENLAEGFGNTATGTYGTASIIKTDASDAIIRYTLNVENGMQMSEAEKFTYAVKYSGPHRANGYYYETISVIPAANIYYEDTYLNFTDSTSAAGGFGAWQNAHSTISVSYHNLGGWNEVYAYCKDDSGPAGVWPGVKMVDNDQDNIYTTYISANQLGKTVMFNNGDKAYKTADLTIAGDGAVYTLDGKWTVYTAKDASIKTVYFQNDQNWSTVKAYCWGDNGEWTVWPGTGMTYDSEKGQYFIEVPADMAYIIFNNGEGTQTGNMEVRDEHVYRTDGYVTGPVKTVYFQNDQNWSTVNAYWWVDTTNNGWPGTAMTQDAVTGLYSITVPADMTNIIFNNGEGNQTNDLGIADHMVYRSDGTYTSLSGGETEKTVYFDAKGCNCSAFYAYYWSYGNTNMTDWPGVEMTYDKATGLYSVVVPADATSIIFHNNKEGEKGDSLGEITIEETGKVYRKDPWEYRVLGNDVFFDNTSSGWAEVYAYYWSYGDTGMTSWPGEKMTLGENGLYHLTIPANAENIVFSNGSSQKQTSDIKIGASGTIYYPDGTMENNNVAPRTYYYSGDNWDEVYAYAWSNETGINNAGFPGEKMTYDEDTGLYSITIKNSAFDMIIFSNGKGQNEGGEQTANLKIPAPDSIYHSEDDYDGDPIIQAEDRPGVDEALESMDANNVYGYDPAYGNCQIHSLGGTRFVTVDKTTGAANAAPAATFTFTGTGFDVVGLTDSDSGAIWVLVTDKDGNSVKSYIVNNYYGYTYDDGEWVITPGTDNALYQVPVIKVENLTYGTYTVTIKAAYLTSMDMQEDGSYTVWLDAIRIYNPAQGDSTSEGAYAQDGESNPHYVNVKDLLVDPGEFTTGNEADGVVFVDGKSSGVTIDEYANQGPNNEAYLKNDHAIAFRLRFEGVNKPNLNLQIGAKLAKGTGVTLNWNGHPLAELTTATNMFYRLEYVEDGQTVTVNWDDQEDAEGNVYWVSDPIVLHCTAENDSILSLTDLKITGADAAAIESMSSAAAEPALMLMSDEVVIKSARRFLMASAAPEIETFTINAAQAELGNALNLYFLFPADAYTDWTGCYAEVTKTYADGRDAVTVTVPAEKWEDVTNGTAALKRVGFHNISAKEMADTVTIRVFNAQGQAISNDYSDTIVAYLDRMLDKNSNPEFRTLAVDMLNYGAAAQTQFNYNTENLANAILTEEQKAYGTAENVACVNNQVKGNNVIGMAVELNNNIVVNVFFQDQTAEMKATVTTATGEILAENLVSTETENGYCFVVDELAVADMRTMIIVTAYNADGSVYGTVTDSVESYVARTGAAKAINQAIMKFSDSAKAYLNND